eukprot:XP_008657838.1 verprolin-like [Zea mays]
MVVGAIKSFPPTGSGSARPRLRLSLSAASCGHGRCGVAGEECSRISPAAPAPDVLARRGTDAGLDRSWKRDPETEVERLSTPLRGARFCRASVPFRLAPKSRIDVDGRSCVAPPPPPLPYSSRAPSISTVLHAPASTIPAPRVVPGLGNLVAPPKFSPRHRPKTSPTSHPEKIPSTTAGSPPSLPPRPSCSTRSACSPQVTSSSLGRFHLGGPVPCLDPGAGLLPPRSRRLP